MPTIKVTTTIVSELDVDTGQVESMVSIGGPDGLGEHEAYAIGLAGCAAARESIEAAYPGIADLLEKRT
jgi:hypothetical protein